MIVSLYGSTWFAYRSKNPDSWKEMAWEYNGSRPLSANIGLALASEKDREFPAL